MKEQPSISPFEKYAAITDRGLEEYLAIFGIEPQELDSARILNLGAGGSDLGKELRERGIFPEAVINFDIAYQTRMNRQRGVSGIYPPARDNVCGDMKALPFESNRFDYCFSLWSLTYYPRFSEREGMVNEALRILKLGGVFAAYPVVPEGSPQIEDVNYLPFPKNCFGNSFSYSYQKMGNSFWTIRVRKEK